MNPIDFNGLDTGVHGPIRLGIMTALQVDGPLDFTTLKKRLETVDGSLNLHLGKLEETGYIAGKKGVRGVASEDDISDHANGEKGAGELFEKHEGVDRVFGKERGRFGGAMK